MKSLKITALSLAALGSVTISGCSAQPEDELESIRQALPQKASVQLQGPENNSAQPTNSASDAGVAPPNAPYATFYTFARGVRDGVNRTTAAILGTVWFIVHTTPTSHDGLEAVWGPFTDPLEPAVWRFRVSHLGGQQYGYILEGRPKSSTSNQEYRAVLSGVGYAKGDEKHGDGTFTIDLDAARALDPVVHANDSGTVTVEHDLPPTVTSEIAPLPRTIAVSLLPSDSGEHLKIHSYAREDQTGALVVDGLVDIDASKQTALENATVKSEWNALGEGRADVTLIGGDIPASLSPVTIVECWDNQFKQSYYKDSAGINATAGDSSACAFADPAAPN